MLCAKFGWNWLSGSGVEFFYMTTMYFSFFIIISPWKRVVPFIWSNLNPLHARMPCAKFGWNWPSGSGEEDENVKVYRRTDKRTDRQTDEAQKVIKKLTWAFSSGELKIKNKNVSSLVRSLHLLFWASDFLWFKLAGSSSDVRTEPIKDIIWIVLMQR